MFQATVQSIITLLAPRVIPPVEVSFTKMIRVGVREIFYDSHKCELHGQYSHSQSIREDVELDVLSIVSLVVGIAGIIYAVFTNKRSEKQREELIAKFNHEREIDQQRYEEEKQREEEQRLRAEEDEQRREQERSERENLECQRQYEAERNRDYLRRSGQRSRFDPKDSGWDAIVTDNGNMITILNLTDKNFVNVVVQVSDHGAKDWEGKEIARFSRISAHSDLTFPGKPTFNDAERITIEGFRENVSEHLKVKVPLAPEETMWDYRGNREYNAYYAP
ncbi:hypothetical protein HH207_09840 [Corynebacterium pseudodiphtheriticum]|nr:hypothetical protein HH207_09840 [Corynebacterium pseudodiphtheriticum]UNU78136.1 hypothetical protein HH208_02375 [Corynebacterium pseudodiphtheriticum]